MKKAKLNSVNVPHNSWVVWTSITVMVLVAGMVLASVLPLSDSDKPPAPEQTVAVAAPRSTGFGSSRNPFGRTNSGLEALSGQVPAKASNPASEVSSGSGVSTDNAANADHSLFQRGKEAIQRLMNNRPVPVVDPRYAPQAKETPLWALSDYDFDQWWDQEETDPPIPDDEKAFDEWWENQMKQGN